VPSPDEFDIKDWERVELATSDGETLNCYFLRARAQTGVTVRIMPLPKLCYIYGGRAHGLAD
jgi:hypothetical protein